MADEGDAASALMDYELTRALAMVRQNSAKNVKRVKFCVECDDLLPELRQEMGFSLCVPCAEETERRRKLYVED